MRLLSSLQNRIFVATVAVALISIALTGRFVTGRVERQAESELQRGLREAAQLLQEHHASRVETLALTARLIADLPKLKAAVATGDAPTVLPIAEEYHTRVRSDLFEVSDADGLPLAVLGGDAEMDDEAVERALAGRESIAFRQLPDRLLNVVTVPLVVGPDPPELLGTLGVGFAIDDRLARELRAVTQSEVALVAGGVVRGSTLGGGAVRGLPSGEGRDAMTRVTLGDEEYAALRVPLSPSDPAGPEAVILRSRSERLMFLRTFRTALILAAVVAALLAVGLSYALARTVTGPLNALTATMREMSATGDLTRRIQPRRSWDDEDAGMLADTFGALTESIRRFQQEAVLRRRLADLGRLSTVIAHEIRNPLMIIKGSLRSLRRAGQPETDRAEALDEIDDEVGRLDRIVGDVLDFARPVRVESAETDVNALCSEAAAATLESEGAPRYALELEPALPAVRTDGERLRTVLVNVLANAADAVGRGNGDGAEAAIRVRTGPAERGGVFIEVRDRGEGIEPGDLPRIFEPYFTTKRTGTGLGLAICRNLVDALGGHLGAESRVGDGTTIRIELPAEAPAAEARV